MFSRVSIIMLKHYCTNVINEYYHSSLMMLGRPTILTPLDMILHYRVTIDICINLQ